MVSWNCEQLFGMELKKSILLAGPCCDGQPEFDPSCSIQLKKDRHSKGRARSSHLDTRASHGFGMRAGFRGLSQALAWRNQVSSKSHESFAVSLDVWIISNLSLGVAMPVGWEAS